MQCRGLHSYPNQRACDPCGSSSTSDCDNADTCDGAGACQANNVADGTGCTDDGNDCTTDTCSAGVSTPTRISELAIPAVAPVPVIATTLIPVMVQEPARLTMWQTALDVLMMATIVQLTHAVQGSPLLPESASLRSLR